MIKIRATLENGQTVIGPIQGSGGYIGSGCLYMGIEHAQLAAMRTIHRATLRAMEKLSTHIYEPQPGHVAMFPHADHESRGDAVHVPLVGTTFELHI